LRSAETIIVGRSIRASIGVTLLWLGIAVPDAAALQRTFVASYGVDANPCTLPMPCRSFGVALAQTAAGGEIVVLDSAGYGSVVIAKSVSLTAPPGIYAGVSVLAGAGITVNAGAGGLVTLRGLSINGLGGTTGIAFQSGDALYVEKVVVAGFAGGGGVGLNAAVGAATAKLIVRDSAFRDNATGLKTGTTSGSLELSIERTMFERNAIGADVQGTTQGVIRTSTFAAGATGVSAGAAGSGRTVSLELRNSTASGNTASGIAAVSASSPTTLAVVSSLVSNNATGIQVSGAGNSAFATDSTILDNAVGLAATSSGAIVSNGDNRLLRNTTDGAFTSTVNHPPDVNAGAPITITLPATASLNGLAFDDGRPNPPAAITTQWTMVSGPGPVVFGNDASLATTASFAAPGDYVLRLTASDSVLSASTDLPVTVNPNPSIVLPPDPATVAPPINLSIATTVDAGSAFLYTGANPIQTGVVPASLDPKRAAVLRGKVLDTNSAPLPGATITILDHPELGQTLSRADGMFDMVVNGGGPLTVNYRKPGFLPAQRQLKTPWQGFVVAPDVVLTPLDPFVTVVDLTSAVPMQVVRGATVTDASGTRRATLMFPAGTTASMTLPGGGSSPLTRLTVRATEYTVGASGPRAMPGELPPTSSYTYAAEYSVDEAITANATGVTFSQPIVSYLENFVGFPVGWDVPKGLYDRRMGQWVAYTNGRVVKILSITGGAVDLDLDGSGVPASGPALAALGITTAERQTLASLYAIGQSLWRAPIEHFSSGDLNWGAGLPPGAKPPNQPPPDDKPPPDSCKAKSSIIECQGQALGEQVDVVGTPYTLNYRSNRVAGFKGANRLRISLSGASVPASLQAIQLEVLVAGRIFTQSFPPTPNQSTTFVWDGQDAYGRTMQGQQLATVRVGYTYQGVYTRSATYLSAFSLYGSSLSSNDTRSVLTLWQEWRANLGAWDARSAGLGGWSLSVHHAYNPAGHVLYRGDGSQGSADAQRINNVITTLAGTNGTGCNGDNGPAALATLFNPVGVAAGADGSVYIADENDHVIRRVGSDGIIKTVAGLPHLGCIGDGSQATTVALNTAENVAVGTDGSFYISDLNANVVLRVASDGTIATVAGTGGLGSSGDGGPATAAMLRPRGVAVAHDGSFYVTDIQGGRVRRVGSDGTITAAAGTGTVGFGGDGGFAVLAKLSDPHGVAVGPDGSLYIADTGNNRIRRVTPDGIIDTFAGTGQSGFAGDGGPATLAKLSSPEAVAAGPDGSVYVTDVNRVRRIGSDGIINTVAGNGTGGAAGDGGPATQGQLLIPRGVAVGPDGSLFIGDSNNNRVRKVSSPLAGFAITDILVPAEDASEVYHFDASGRHLGTLDPRTGAALYTFAYDAAGRLTTVTDVAANVTTIQRTAGNPTGVVGPFGQHTTLALDANGYLSSITDPASQATVLGSTADGLLTSLTDPRGGPHTFAYDGLGRLILDQAPAGASTSLNRVDGNQSYTVTRTTALSRISSYEIDRLASGDEQRINTDPSGFATLQLNGVNATDTITDPDGTITSETLGPDPRWGLLAPIATTATIHTPAGKVLTMLTSRTAALTNPNDPLSLSTEAETITVNGNAFTGAYVAATRTKTDTTPVGRQSTETIDPQGRTVQTRLAGFEAINRTYDGRGRLATMSEGTGVNTRSLGFAYNANGYLQTFTDALSHTQTLSYDLAGRITTHTLTDGSSIQYTYDANGNVTSVTPPGRPVHTFSYTALDLLSAYVPPNVGAGSNQTLFAYNADRQLTLETRPDGKTIAYGYDVGGRSSTVTVSGGVYGFGYDSTTGNLSSITAPGSIGLTFTYDGRLPTGTTWTGPVTGAVTRSYDNDLRVASIAVSGTSISRTYDNDSQLTQAGALTLTRDPQNGFVTGSTLGSVTDAWTYNGFGEVATHTVAYLGTQIFAQQFTRDKLGRITQKTETIGGTTDVYVYNYDLAGRIASVSKNAVTTATYSYDANGNRLSVVDGGGTTLGTYDNQDRLTQYGTALFAYTANGELQSRTVGAQVTTYNYDEFGNLNGVNLPGGTQLAYLVDGENRRIGRKVNGTLTKAFLYQDYVKPIAELDGASSVVSRFVYAMRDNVPDYMTKGGVTYRIIGDPLGSPRLVVDVATGTIAQRIDYDEFGRVLSDTNPGFQPFGFGGGLYDASSGLVRFGARDYDAAAGRWTAKDPVLITAGEANLYAYARNDPVNRRDPVGLQLKDFDQQQQEKKDNACPPEELKAPPGFKRIKEYQDVRKEVAGDKSADSAKGLWESIKAVFAGFGK
jgi:RHS repeat-associated protein